MLRTLPTPRTPAVGGTRAAQAGLAVVLGALLLSSCVSSTPPPAEAAPVVLPAITPMPTVLLEPVDEATIALVEDYWIAREAAWAGGVGTGIAFSLANNHPLLDYTPEQCLEAWFDGEPPIGFAERNTLFPETIVSDPDFRMAVGPIAGRDLGRGLLEMQVLFSYERVGPPVADRKATVHLQVIDGRVRHFLLCDPLQITVVEVDAAPDTAGTGTVGGIGIDLDGDGIVDTVAGGGTPTLTDPVTVLPPVTVTPAPVAPPGNGGGGGDGGGGGGGSTAPSPPGSRPPGSGIDFCDTPPPAGDQPSAGDYYLCPDDDVDPTATQPPSPSAQPSEDVTRG